jgi:hypothetical protein
MWNRPLVSVSVVRESVLDVAATRARRTGTWRPSSMAVTTPSTLAVAETDASRARGGTVWARLMATARTTPAGTR